MDSGWWRRRLAFFATVTIAVGFWLAAFAWRLHRELNPPEWENEIVAFERGDLTNQPPEESVLFVGSSTVALWETLRKDLPRFRVFRRGFGGAHMSDVIAYSGRIILPYPALMAIVHAGGNDLAAGKTPAEVSRQFADLVERIHRGNPQMRIGFISIKPSPARWHLIDQIRETNRMIQEYTATDDRLVFIDIFDLMLNAEGKPNVELYDADGLHLSREGYRVWADAVRPYLPHEARKRTENTAGGSIIPTPPEKPQPITDSLSPSPHPAEEVARQ